MSDTKTISSGDVTVNLSVSKVYEYCLQSTMNAINVVKFLRAYHIYMDWHYAGKQFEPVKIADKKQEYDITFSVSNQTKSISIEPNTELVSVIDIDVVSKTTAEYIFNAMVNQNWDF